MPKRETGPDLIRCLAFLFVVVFHSFLYNSYYTERQTGWQMVLADGFRWLSVSCIGLFLMLSGYLLSHLLDSWAYGSFPRWHTPQNYWKLFLCVSLPIFAISVLLGHFLQAAAEILLRRRKRVTV